MPAVAARMASRGGDAGRYQLLAQRKPLPRSGRQLLRSNCRVNQLQRHLNTLHPADSLSALCFVAVAPAGRNLGLFEQFQVTAEYARAC